MHFEDDHASQLNKEIFENVEDEYEREMDIEHRVWSEGQLFDAHDSKKKKTLHIEKPAPAFHQPPQPPLNNHKVMTKREEKQMLSMWRVSTLKSSLLWNCLRNGWNSAWVAKSTRSSITRSHQTAWIPRYADQGKNKASSAEALSALLPLILTSRLALAFHSP